MTRKPPERPAPSDPQDQRLRELGRRWFAEARQQSRHDDAEVENWRHEWKRWHGHRHDPSRIFEDYWLRAGAEDEPPPPRPKRPGS